MIKVYWKTFWRYLLIGIAFPFIVQYVFYFRYTSNYMPNSFSETGFNATYNQNIFRYRILGRSLHLWLYHQLMRSEKIRNFKEEPIYSKRLTALDANANETFYLTYFILAVTFAILTALALLYLFDIKGLFPFSESQKIFVTSALTGFIGFVQFTMTPYDNITYFLLIATCIFLFKYLLHPHWMYFVLLNLCIIIYTLNHESAFVALCIIAAVGFVRTGLNVQFLHFIWIPVACFLATYIALRILIPNISSNGIADGWKIGRNLNVRKLSSLVGLLFMILSFYFLFKASNNPVNKKLIYIFLFMAFPYIIIIPTIGIMIELRLWMPVLLGGFLLSRVNLSVIENRTDKNQNIYPVKDAG